MSEIIPRISQTGGVELTHDGAIRIEETGSIAATEAAFLARGILSCAAALAAPNPPPAGVLGGDAHLPIMQWTTGKSNITGDPVLLLTVPPGIQLTFVMSPEGATAVGRALIAQGAGTAPPAGHHGTIH